MAKVLMSLESTAKSRGAFAACLQLDPTIPVAHFRLSTIYRQTGRTEEAKHEIEEYQKYNEMKQKLRAVYHDLHRDQARDENDDPDSKK